MAKKIVVPSLRGSASAIPHESGSGLRLRNGAQGALEYLLLIGGAVVVAAVVLTLITGITGTAQTATESRATDVLCAPFPKVDCGFNGKDPDGSGLEFGPNACKWDAPGNRCVACGDYNPSPAGVGACNDLDSQCGIFVNDLSCATGDPDGLGPRLVGACAWNSSFNFCIPA